MWCLEWKTNESSWGKVEIKHNIKMSKMSSDNMNMRFQTLFPSPSLTRANVGSFLPDPQSMMKMLVSADI